MKHVYSSCIFSWCCIFASSCPPTTLCCSPGFVSAGWCRVSETLLVVVAGWWWMCRGSVEYPRRGGLVSSDAADTQHYPAAVTDCPLCDHWRFPPHPPPPDMILHLIPHPYLSLRGVWYRLSSSSAPALSSGPTDVGYVCERKSSVNVNVASRWVDPPIWGLRLRKRKVRGKVSVV